MKKEEFRIAHISDLHFGPSHDATTAEHLINDLKRVVKPDIVIVSGDLTDWAKHSELEQAHNFLDRLCKECQIDVNKRLFVIPGNHDVNNIGGRVYDGWKLSSSYHVQRSNT